MKKRFTVRNDSGQAMVEFTLILLIILALCAGMLWTSRLLTFEFWAQQEARYLAFEQTWAAQSSYSDSVGEPVAKLDDREYLRRPRLIDRLDVDKEITDQGNVSELIPFLSKLDSDSSGTNPSKSVSPPVMIAKRKESIWTAKTSELLVASKNRFSLIRSAFATEDMTKGSASSLTELEEAEENIVPDAPKERRRRALERILAKGGFGGKFCSRMSEVASKHNYPQFSALFQRGQCGTHYEREFSGYVSDNLNIAQIFRDFEYRLESGFETGDALHNTIDDAVASQFYSFFDTIVRTSFITAFPLLVAKRVEYGTVTFDPSVTRLFSDMRYVGSIVAISSINVAMPLLLTLDPTNRNPQVEKDLEDTLNTLLHADAADAFGDSVPGVDNGFFLNPMYLPVPPTFGPVLGGLQSGLMKNILFKEPNRTQLVNDLIENSNKLAEVRYDSTQGSFSAARRRFNTTGKILTSRFFLVTQPWHIPRRESPFGPFREKGDQFDDIDEETDEGILRRRVYGLWLLPSDISALLDPLSEIPELAPIFEPISFGINLVEGPVNLIKDFIGDNPLFEIFDALSSIPGFGSIVPTLPQWPAVRPDAYPGSTEMNNDKMAGEPRSFKDYIDEQREFNPPPNPVYNDD